MNRQRATFINIIETMTKQQELYTEAMSSSGTMMEVQEKYLDSYEGKLGTLRATFESLMSNSLNSDFMKGTIDSLSGGINVLDTAVNKFGLLPTVLTTIIPIFALFNSKLRENIDSIARISPTYTKWSNSLKQNQMVLSEQITGIKKAIVEVNNQRNAMIKTGQSTTAYDNALSGLNSKLSATTTSLIATKVATIALQTVLSVGMGLAISAVITVITKLADKLITTKTEIKELNEEFANMSNVGSSDRLAYLIDQYSNIQNALKNTQENTEAYTVAQENLASITEEICSIFPNASTVIDAETGSKKLNLAETEKMIEAEKALYEAKANEVMSKNKINNTDDIKELANDYAEAMSKMKEYNDLMSQGEKSIYQNGQKTSLSGNLSKTTEEVEEYKDKIETLLPALKELESINPSLKGGYDLLYEALYGVDEAMDSVEDSNVSDTLNGIANSADEASNSLKDLSDSFSGLQDGIELLQTMKDEFSEYGMIDTSTMEKVLSSGDSQLIALLGDEANFIDNINKLLDEKSTAQDQALQSAIATAQAEVNGSQEVIDATNAEAEAITQLENTKSNISNQSVMVRANAEASLVNTNASNYNADGTNFANKENSKIKGSFVSANNRIDNEKNVTDKNSANYSVDDKNHVTLTNSKISANDSYTNVAIANAKTTTDKLNENYRTDAKNYASYINSIIDNIRARAKAESALTGGSLGFANESAEVIAKYQEYLKLLKEAENASKTVDSYVGSGGVSGSVGHGNVGNGSSGGSSSSNSEVSNIEETTDWYIKLNNAISDNNRLLEENRNAQEYANGTDRIKLMKEEIKLLEKQAQANKNLADAYDVEAKQSQDFLSSQGFQFDSMQNLTGNVSEKILELKKNANKLNGAEKEAAIYSIELIEKNIDRFTELTNNLIPDLRSEVESLNNSIKDLYQDQLDLVADTEKEIYDVIEYYATKTKDAKVKAIEEQIDALEKLYALEDKEDELTEKQNDLTDIKNQMDLYENAQDSQGKAKYEELKKQYDELLKDMNSTIRDNQKDAITESLEAQKDSLDKELEDFLSPENINKVIADAMKNGYINLGDEVLDLNSATTQYLAETTIGTQNLINANTELMNSYLSIKDIMSDIASLNANLGNIGVDFNSVYSGISRSNAGNSVTFGNVTIEIQGNTNMNQDDITSAIQKALINVSNNYKF